MSLHALPLVHREMPLRGCPRWAGSSRSALEVGGDFYEVLALSENSLLGVIADVMGKGAPASVFAESLRTLIHALAKPGADPGGLLSEINEVLFDDLSNEDLFITAQFLVADLCRGRLQVASAGHCPLLVCGPRGRSWSVSPNGIPLGIQRNAEFRTETTVLPPFGAALLYTDGITEARNARGRFFGQQRLEQWLSRGLRQYRHAEHLKADLLRELSDFQGSTRGTDDQTFLVLCDETPQPFAALFADARWDSTPVPAPESWLGASGAS